VKDRFENIEEIIAKFLAGEANSDEIALLEQWKNVNSENRKYYDDCVKLFESGKDFSKSASVDVDAAWNRVHERISKNIKPKLIPINRNNSKSFFYRIAASIILVVGIGYILFELNDNSSSQTVLINTADTIKAELLPDGSTITLNKNSQLAYQQDQFSNKRIVKLKGEAFFDVLHDEANPFIVEAGDLKIEDIGTSFNVNANENSGIIIISVVSGEVKLSTINHHTLLLNAGDEGRYDVSSKSLSKSEFSDPNITAYTNKVFIFEDAELSTVLKVLNDVYDVKLKTQNANLLSCRITVTFDNETINEIAEVIAETLGLKIINDDHTIFFSGDACIQ